MEPKTWAVTIRNNRIFLTDPDSETTLEETLSASSVQDILQFAENNRIKLRSLKIQTAQFSRMLDVTYWIGEQENQINIKRIKNDEIIINIRF